MLIKVCKPNSKYRKVWLVWRDEQEENIALMIKPVMLDNTVERFFFSSGYLKMDSDLSEQIKNSLK